MPEHTVLFSSSAKCAFIMAEVDDPIDGDVEYQSSTFKSDGKWLYTVDCTPTCTKHLSLIILVVKCFWSSCCII